MTPSWSPFPLAFDVLPKVLHHGRSQGNYSKAFAIFEPERRIVSIEEVPFGKQVFRCEIPAADHNQPLEHIHAQHFLWLLNLTVARAVLMKKPVLLAGLPGFSYQNELERDLHGEGKLRLLKAGYLYPDRVPQGARFEYLTNDEARRVRAEKLSAMKEEAQNLPPPPSV